MRGTHITDITTAEKKQIRSRARRFVQDLSDAPLEAGLQLYHETIDELYKRSSRLRMCLKCGNIDTIDKLTEKHSCARNLPKFPVLVTTSWLRMREFFLSPKYVTVLQNIGVEPVVEKEVPIRAPAEAEVSSDIPDEEIAEVEVD
jgi:hypothetical protein